MRDLGDKILTYAIVGTVAYILIAKPRLNILGVPLISVDDNQTRSYSPPASSVVTSNPQDPFLTKFTNIVNNPLNLINPLAGFIGGYLQK